MESSLGTLKDDLLAKDILFCISSQLGVNPFSTFFGAELMSKTSMAHKPPS